MTSYMETSEKIMQREAAKRRYTTEAIVKWGEAVVWRII